MRCENKGRGKGQQPACRVTWDYITYQDCTAQQRADWDWLWSRLLMPTKPKTPEAPVGDTGASQDCEPDIANRRRGRGVTNNEVHPNGTTHIGPTSSK
jgi:hypothetical protein